MSVTLEDHQTLGLNWTPQQEHGNRKGGLLCDDMSLDKTIQTMDLMLSPKSENPGDMTTLIIRTQALVPQRVDGCKSKKRGHQQN